MSSWEHNEDEHNYIRAEEARERTAGLEYAERWEEDRYDRDSVNAYRVDIQDTSDGSRWYGFWAAGSEEAAREAAASVGETITDVSGPFLKERWKVVNA